jgi:hypothetical protein
MIGEIFIPYLSTEYFVGLGTGFFSTGVLAGLFFYYFKRPKPGGGGPIGGQDACIQPFAPVYSNAIVESQELPVFVGLNRDDDFLDWHVSEPRVSVEVGTGPVLVELPDNVICEVRQEATLPSYSSANVGPDLDLPDNVKADQRLDATYMEESIQTNEVIERRDVGIQLELPAG